MFTYLQSPDLGGGFRNLLKIYFLLEKSSGFANGKGAAHALYSKNRPEAIHWWISRARTGCPPIQDIHTFANQFWTWWCGLQPAWRKLSIPQYGQAVPALRTVAGGWAELDKPGLNGFLSIIAALNWWGAQVQAEEAQFLFWNAAVEDVSWVMEQLIETRFAGNNGNPELVSVLLYVAQSDSFSKGCNKATTVTSHRNKQTQESSAVSCVITRQIQHTER